MLNWRPGAGRVGSRQRGRWEAALPPVKVKADLSEDINHMSRHAPINISQSKAKLARAASVFEPESPGGLASMTARGGHAKEPAPSRPPREPRHPRAS